MKGERKRKDNNRGRKEEVGASVKMKGEKGRRE